MTEIGVSYEGSFPLSTLEEVAIAADEAGASRLWAASHLFQREPIVSACLTLAKTKKLGAGLMAMSPYTVHPVYATMAVAALDELFPGRITLCFGAGAPRDLEAVGIEATKPLEAMRESLAIARALLAGETVNYQGQRFSAASRRLSSGAHRVPIMIAASGPKMLELAGAESDGVLISAATSPAFVNWALDHVRAGEKRGGRSVQKSALVFTAVSTDGESARNRLRRNLGFILRGAHHAQNLALAGTKIDQQALAAAYAREDWATVEAMIDERTLDNHTASGTPEQVRASLQRYRDVGLTEIVLAGLSSGPELRLAL